MKIINLLILLLSFSLILSRGLFETKEELNKRLSFYNSKSEEITNNRIVFKHSEEKGIYCEAKQKTLRKEFVFSIKKEYLICGCK